MWGCRRRSRPLELMADNRVKRLKLSSTAMQDGALDLTAFATGDREPILEPYWPGRLHRFVWRNWPLVDAVRLAKVIGTGAGQVEQIAASMGLGPQPPIRPDQLRRSAITIIRRNWHELPYEQLLALLGWDQQRLATALKEDDFLWIKLGGLKPRCQRLRYTEAGAAADRRAAAIRACVQEQFGPDREPGRPPEPRFAFIDELGKPQAYARCSPAPPAGPDQVALDSSWQLVVPDGSSELVRSAAVRLAGFMAACFGIELPVSHVPTRQAPSNCIRLTIEQGWFDRPESHEVNVAAGQVDVIAGDEPGLLRGLQYLQQQMEDRRAPHLQQGRQRRNTRFWPRFLYSYLALFADAEADHEQLYPDGYLERLCALGVNGVWFQGLLRALAPCSAFPEFGNGCKKNLDNLNGLIDRVGRYGIGVWMYLNEPRCMPASFFDQHPDVAGVRSADGGPVTMCTSTEPVRRFLTDSTEHVLKHAPALAGVFTITASENLTNCAMTGPRMADCPRCCDRDPAAIIAEVTGCIAEGVRRSRSAARLIAWDWGWQDAISERVIWQLPNGVMLMSVSEWQMPIRRGPVDTQIGEYCISVAGPGPRARRHWHQARQRGLEPVAKVQVNNSWEFSPAPYVLVLPTVAEHFARLVDAGVVGLMLGWTLGGCPSPNLQLARQFYWDPVPEPDEALATVARSRYGPETAARAMVAWKGVATAMKAYPYHINVVYFAPVQMGPANPLYDEPTGYPATMSGMPYDDLDRWRGPYPANVLADQFAAAAAQLAAPVARLDRLARNAEANFASNLNQDRDMVLALQLTLASAADQVRFIVQRNRLRQTGDAAGKRSIIDQLERLIRAELQRARQMHDLACRDSRIGYEAANHYFYVPADLVEKVINCHWLLGTWLPAQRRKHLT